MGEREKKGYVEMAGPPCMLINSNEIEKGSAGKQKAGSGVKPEISLFFELRKRSALGTEVITKSLGSRVPIKSVTSLGCD